MSKNVSDDIRHYAAHDPGNGLTTPRFGSEIRGPITELDRYEDTDHFALIYETQDEQFATVVPFIRDGIERGERCLYITDENSREEILAALQDGGVDVDTALESNQLSIYSVEDTYLESGEFDVDSTLDLLETAQEEAIAEYEGFRVTAEETWLVGDEATQDAFTTCESRVNELLDGDAGMALCQYNRSKLSPEVIEDVIETHPYLVYDGTVCENFYYTPPEEYFGPDCPARDNERKLATLVDRTEARASLQTREYYERELHRIISQPDSSFEEKLDALFDLGCDRFGLEIGGVAKVDPGTDLFEVEAVSDDHEHLVPGARADLSETYCRVPAASDSAADTEPVDITDPVSSGFDGNLCYDEFGVRAYLGSHLDIEGDDDRTFWFVSTEPREEDFSEAERTFHHLMGQWVKYELERQQRERVLERTKQRFKTVFENSNDAIFLLDPSEDEFIDVNPAVLEMLGYDREELLARGPSDIHPEEMEQFRTFIDSVFEDGHGWTDELTCRAKNGETIPAEISASPVKLEDRDLLLAIVRDITERKEHERYQRELYETIADTDASFTEKVGQLLKVGSDRFDLEIGYFTKTGDDDTFEILEAVGDHDEIRAGVTDSLCDTYCEKLLATPGPISVTDAAEVGWTDDPAYERFRLDAYFATTIHIGGDEYGTLCFASETPREKPFSDAERTFLDLIGQWVEYELERRRQERYVRRSYEITSDPARSFDEKLQALFDLGCEHFDMELGAMARVDTATDRFEIERTSGDHEYFEPGLELDLSETYCTAATDADGPASVSTPEQEGYGDITVRTEFGIESYLGTQITVPDGDNRTFFFVTEEPRDEPFTEVERTFHHLMGQWVEYELERKQRERALEESNQRLEQFAYAASHDLQEPLRMVTSYLQLLENRYGDAFDEDGDEFLAFAVDGAERMREMIDGLLEYSRVETRGEPFEPVDLDAVFGDVLADLTIQIEETDAEITSERLPRVKGDANQLRQVFQNLLSNAITYSGDDPPRVHIDAERRCGEWVISVADNGIGIDPADQDRVFTVFDRLHSRDEYEGTGIGLALCQRIVERHDGEIWVDSEPGEGSTFSFTLPAL